MTELNAAEKWLFDTLRAYSALTALIVSEASPSTYGKCVYVDVIPEVAIADSNLPCVLAQHADGKDTMTQMQGRNQTDFTFIVKAVTVGNSKQSAHNIAVQIDAAIHNQYNSSYNSYQINCQRTKTFSVPYVEDGKRFNQVGGYYRVIVRPL